MSDFGEYSVHPHTRRIATAGLRHWHPRAEASAEEFLQRVLESANTGITERDFMRRDFEAVTDPRWVQVLYRTVLHSIYEEHRQAQFAEVIPLGDSSFQIDTLTCHLPAHKRFDGLHAKATSDLWRGVVAPFDWTCGCTRMFIPLKTDLMDGSLLTARSSLITASQTWLMHSPEKAVERI